MKLQPLDACTVIMIRRLLARLGSAALISAIAQIDKGKDPLVMLPERDEAEKAA